ncbi:hypothetical protein D3C72_1095810 [compost metagenome]
MRLLAQLDALRAALQHDVQQDPQVVHHRLDAGVGFVVPVRIVGFGPTRGRAYECGELTRKCCQFDVKRFR